MKLKWGVGEFFSPCRQGQNRFLRLPPSGARLKIINPDALVIGLLSSNGHWGIYSEKQIDKWFPRAPLDVRGMFLVVDMTVPGSRPEFFERLRNAKAYCEEMT